MVLSRVDFSNNNLLLILLISIEYFLADARDANEYTEAHIVLAKGVKKDEKGERRIPFGVHLPSLMHCVVYDGNTVSIVEESEFC